MEEKKPELSTQSQQTNEISQLGFLEKTYGGNFGGYLGCAAALLAFFTILLSLAGAFRSPGGWVGFIIVFVCVAGSVVVSFFHRTWQASVYAEGLVVTRGKQVQVARWQDIIAVDRLVRTISSNAGGYTTRSKQTNYQIRLRTGPAIMLTNDFSNRSELIERIETKMQQAKIHNPVPQDQ